MLPYDFFDENGFATNGASCSDEPEGFNCYSSQSGHTTSQNVVYDNVNTAFPYDEFQHLF